MFWQCELSSLAFEILGLIIFACRLDQCYNQFWGSVVNNTKPFAARKFQRRNHLDKLHHMPVAESTCAKKKKGIMFIFWKEPSNALGVRNNTMLWICQSDTTIRFHPRRRANENILSYLLVPVHWSIIQIRGSQKTPLQICIRIKRPFLFVARIKRMGLWETLEEPIYVLYKWAHQVKLRARTRRRFLSLRRTKRRFWYVLTVIALLGKTVFQV